MRVFLTVSFFCCALFSKVLFAGDTLVKTPLKFYPERIETFQWNKERYQEKYLNKKWKLHSSINNYRSVFNDREFSFNSFYGSVEFDRTYRMGLVVVGQERAVILNDNNENFNYELSEVGFLAVQGEYLIVNNYRWELAVPLIFGGGGGRLITLDRQGEWTGEEVEKRFRALQFGVYAQYNINYWLGFGVGAGHRWAFADDTRVEDYVTSTYYTFGFKFGLFRLMKSIFAHRKVKAEKELYFRGVDTL